VGRQGLYDGGQKKVLDERVGEEPLKTQKGGSSICLSKGKREGEYKEKNQKNRKSR